MAITWAGVRPCPARTCQSPQRLHSLRCVGLISPHHQHLQPPVLTIRCPGRGDRVSWRPALKGGRGGGQNPQGPSLLSRRIQAPRSAEETPGAGLAPLLFLGISMLQRQAAWKLPLVECISRSSGKRSERCYDLELLCRDFGRPRPLPTQRLRAWASLRALRSSRLRLLFQSSFSKIDLMCRRDAIKPFASEGTLHFQTLLSFVPVKPGQLGSIPWSLS